MDNLIHTLRMLDGTILEIPYNRIRDLGHTCQVLELENVGLKSQIVDDHDVIFYV
jgi:hypothetical protein